MRPKDAEDILAFILDLGMAPEEFHEVLIALLLATDTSQRTVPDYVAQCIRRFRIDILYLCRILEEHISSENS